MNTISGEIRLASRPKRIPTPDDFTLAQTELEALPYQQVVVRNLTTILLVVIAICLVSCVKNATPVALAEYSTTIVGHWQGTVGSARESMTIDGNGTFVCQIHPMGFLANTLSQSVAGKVSGTWNINGAIIILKITGEKHEHLGDRITSSTIETFKADELTLKSARGETSTFERMTGS